jgi:hypothetical protein
MSRVELIVNGEIRESLAVNPHEDAGTWRVRVEKSAWIALLVRGNQPGRREVIAAHSSPVMVEVEGSPFMAAADAVTILEQLEGTLAFLDTLATRSDARTFKRLKLALTSAHRKLHNRMHASGHGHEHTTGRDHPEHGKA